MNPETPTPSETAMNLTFSPSIPEHSRTVSHSREYKTWMAMKMRCTDPNDDNYYKYGKRGIKVCERWLNSFENFYADMGTRPDGRSIDRKETTGNYEPENCRWATFKEQNNNMARCVKIEWNGEIMTRTQWAEKFGVCARALRHRMSLGTSLMDAVNEIITGIDNRKSQKVPR